MIEQVLFIVFFAMAMGFLLGFLVGMIYQASREEKVEICEHDGGRVTTFNTLEDLRQLFSGTMSPEEYSKLSRKEMFTTTCFKCRKEIR